MSYRLTRTKAEYIDLSDPDRVVVVVDGHHVVVKPTSVDISNPNNLVVTFKNDSVGTIDEYSGPPPPFLVRHKTGLWAGVGGVFALIAFALWRRK
jgi:hypothetical protein